MTVSAFVLSWFIAAGFDAAHAQALSRLAWDETRFEYCAASPYGDHGLYQWRGQRWSALQRFAGTAGCPKLETQLRFARHELNTTFAEFSLVPGHRAYQFLKSCFAQGRC